MKKFKFTKKNILIIILIAIIAIIAIALTIYFYPKIKSFADSDVKERLKAYFDSLGFLGVLMMFAIQLLQVFLAFIPGEPVEVLFGFVYGPWAGLALCLAGAALASVVIFACVNAFGKKFTDKFADSSQFEKLKFLNDPARRDGLIFLLFLIPGTPKDMLVYFAPFTKIPIGRFLLLSTIARIPSVITSTFAGDNIYGGNYLTTIIIFAVTGIIGIAGILFNNKFIEKKNAKNDDTDR